MIKSARLEFLGAVGTVTGSRSLLRHNGSRYLVDCGLFQGPREFREKNWDGFSEASKIDAVFLTHAHIDHSGYLPKLVKEGFEGPIYCSEGTKALCEIMLLDAAHLQEEDAEFANRNKHSRHEPALPLYTTEDAEKALSQLKVIDQNKILEMSPGIGVQFLRAGHILGSNIIQFHYEVPNGSKIVTFSGDLGNGRSFIVKPPVTLSETDYLILESTYGDRVQPRIDVLEVMARVVNQVIGRGGTLVIPAFSVGRSQEILYVLNRLQEEKRIQPVPVYLDSPMALDATQIYMSFEDELRLEERNGKLECPICPPMYKPVRSADESMLLCMSDEPKIVISAAGMLTGGRILHHLKAKLPDEKSAVLFVGYQVEGTKGRLLRHGLKSIRIHHQPVSVEAEVLAIDSFSAHADSDDLIQWMKTLKKAPEKIFLNHGEKSASEALKYRILTELGFPCEVAEGGAAYSLI